VFGSARTRESDPHYGLKTETVEVARTHAFTTLVFAELLRSFGCRSEVKPVWRLR
jgi:Ca2+-transporting ATPase